MVEKPLRHLCNRSDYHHFVKFKKMKSCANRLQLEECNVTSLIPTKVAKPKSKSEPTSGQIQIERYSTKRAYNLKKCQSHENQGKTKELFQTEGD